MYVDLWSNTPYCFGGSDGSIIANTWGGNWPYSYSWDNGATSDYVTGLAAGTYNVTVTDDNGCTDTEQVVITQDISTPTAGITNNTGETELTCSTTTISLTATGGTSYSWSDGSSEVAATSELPSDHE